MIMETEITRKKTISFQAKKCAHTEKKEHRKNNEKKKIKGKEINKMAYQYSISFKTLYCNLTAI